jgi:hypothetical protein
MNEPKDPGYECFDRLIAGLKAEGYQAEAQRLHSILHEVAWTTSSELVGELGLEIVAIQRTSGAYSVNLSRRLDDCMEVVKRVWPAIGQ